jgi:hypothetical protein
VFDAINQWFNFLFLRFHKSVFSSLNVASAGDRRNGSDFDAFLRHRHVSGNGGARRNGSDFDAFLRHRHVSGNGGGRLLANDCGGDVYLWKLVYFIFLYN